ncbi:MAG: amidohydrolase family protein [Cyanobacteriota bacterium]|nr:amidohydrolase family protein [Cyanobacteriota bacterium]
MIIDSLTHVTPDGRWFSTPYDASETRLLQEMDAHGVDKAIVVALADYIENDFVEIVCKRHTDRLIPGASINPVAYATHKQAAEQARSIVSEGLFPVLKLHPRLHRYDVSDSRCLAVLEAMEESGSSTCVWLDTLLRYRGALLRKPPIDAVHDLVGRFTSLKFVLLHSCGADILRLAEAIRDCPNAFLDISYTLPRYRGSSVELDLKYLLQTFEQRMVFGSDFPEVSIPEALGEFESLSKGIPYDKRSRVLEKNLGEILGI